ncbi:hypothetical protein [Brevundimonas sp. Root1423]|uniref:hypothetical protein n=1 Tax=Brevundimonas sp. Root1423 TaxID=1736462 RepID=UPI0006FD07AA|nr:hypothetical protein [Brevundimonas sp. Root1423]KQY75215.1 hypothetical protein ASD25_11665 [Brevundimonas sp. Root1423]
MKRLEPNLLLAITTGCALLLVVITATVYGPPASLIRNPLLAIICAGGFVLLNPVMLRIMKIAPRPPLIHPDSRSTAAWATIFPMLVIAAAAIPVFMPGPDYGLLVIIASVWFGATVESAIKASRQAG